MIWEIEVVKILASSVVGYFVGNRAAKVKDKRTRTNERIREGIKLIRETSDEATKYFTNTLEARERSASCAVIMSSMKRIAFDLCKVAECCSHDQKYFSKEWRRFFDAVTSEPFGSDTIDIVNHNHNCIRIIQEAEKFLVERLSALEDN